jgi:prepilin-type N-terminal cleavage/methylation domain-containing protein
MYKKSLLKTQSGFTLVELLSVMIIMGVMTSVSIKKYDLLSDTASVSAINAAIRELNTREALVWAQMKLSDSEWSNDVDVYNGVDKTLGQGYHWNPGPTISGGTLYYHSISVDLNRTASTRKSVGSWN